MIVARAVVAVAVSCPAAAVVVAPVREPVEQVVAVPCRGRGHTAVIRLPLLTIGVLPGLIIGVLTLGRRRRILRRRLLAGLVGGAMAHRTGWRGLLRLISRRRNGIRRCRGGSRCGYRGRGRCRCRGSLAGRGGWSALQPMQRAEDAGSCGGNETAADKHQQHLSAWTSVAAAEVKAVLRNRAARPTTPGRARTDVRLLVL